MALFAARHLIILMTALRMIATVFLWRCSDDLALSGFVLFYLAGFFFDIAEGPAALFLDEVDQRLSRKELLFYDLVNSFFLCSFFYLTADKMQSNLIRQTNLAYTLYLLLGILCQHQFFLHTYCYNTEDLHNHFLKKSLRLGVKISSLLMIIALLNGIDETRPSFFEQGIGLLLLSVASHYLLLLSPLYWQLIKDHNEESDDRQNMEACNDFSCHEGAV